MTLLCLGIIFLVCAALSATVLLQKAGTLSLSYGLCVSSIGFTMCILGVFQLIPLNIVHYLLFTILILYGNRISGEYLQIQSREEKNRVAFTQLLKGMHPRFQAQRRQLLIAWGSNTLLAFASGFPLIICSIVSSGSSVCNWIGLIIMVSGFLLKNHFKPHVEDYVFWVGAFIAPIASVQLSYIGIAYVLSAVVRFFALSRYSV